MRACPRHRGRGSSPWPTACPRTASTTSRRIAPATCGSPPATGSRASTACPSASGAWSRGCATTSSGASRSMRRTACGSAPAAPASRCWTRAASASPGTTPPRRAWAERRSGASPPRAMAISGSAPRVPACIACTPGAWSASCRARAMHAACRTRPCASWRSGATAASGWAPPTASRIGTARDSCATTPRGCPIPPSTGSPPSAMARCGSVRRAAWCDAIATGRCTHRRGLPRAARLCRCCCATARTRTGSTCRKASAWKASTAW